MAEFSERFMVMVSNKSGTIYSWMADQEYLLGDDEYAPAGKPYYVEGDWSAPFPNAPEDCLAFGIVEALAQSEDCPPAFYRDPITRVRITKI